MELLRFIDTEITDVVNNFVINDKLELDCMCQKGISRNNVLILDIDTRHKPAVNTLKISKEFF